MERAYAPVPQELFPHKSYTDALAPQLRFQ